MSVSSMYMNTKDGTFWFTPDEWKQMRTETPAERLARVRADFEDDIGYEACVYLSNKLTAFFLTEHLQ